MPFFSVALRFLRACLPHRLKQDPGAVGSCESSLAVFEQCLCGRYRVSVTAFGFRSYDRGYVRSFVMCLGAGNGDPNAYGRELATLGSCL